MSESEDPTEVEVECDDGLVHVVSTMSRESRLTRADLARWADHRRVNVIPIDHTRRPDFGAHETLHLIVRIAPSEKVTCVACLSRRFYL